MSTAHIPTILLSLSLLALPGVFLLEKNETSLWNGRLLFPSRDSQVNLHTPIHTDGTYLPSTISNNLTLTPADNPVILPGPTSIQPLATLTLEPGVHLYALEHAALHVEGTLNLPGTAEDPIRLTSNESHPANRSWSGLIVSPTGRLTGQHAILSYATPAISCLAGSGAILQHLSISHTNTGIFTASPNCTLANSRIQARQTGVISTITNPPINETIIQARHQLTIKQP